MRGTDSKGCGFAQSSFTGAIFNSMLGLLSEFMRNVGRTITVIVMDKDHMEQPRSFMVEPRRLLWGVGAAAASVVVVLLALLLLTPIRYALPGYGSLEMRRSAVENQIRLESLEDSLRIQTEYVARLRDTFLGNVRPDSGSSGSAGFVSIVSSDLEAMPLPVATDDWEEHQQPAFRFDQLGMLPPSRPQPDTPSSAYLSALSFPVLPPVSGIATRGFDARTGHFAVDVALEEGSAIRSIGDGYVILADWLNDGGQVIAIAHADGYISVFKHNSSLLKQVGDRVTDREVVALSGNSGEITTGPHVHFELWQNGLAQDPRAYVLGW